VVVGWAVLYRVVLYCIVVLLTLIGDIKLK
jgi:hypothetical protein